MENENELTIELTEAVTEEVQEPTQKRRRSRKAKVEITEELPVIPMEPAPFELVIETEPEPEPEPVQEPEVEAAQPAPKLPKKKLIRPMKRPKSASKQPGRNEIKARR